MMGGCIRKYIIIATAGHYGICAIPSKVTVAAGRTYQCVITKTAIEPHLARFPFKPTERVV
ncbi:MAG: hypothetical protein U1B30_11445, partial [Pseudomonadota bacterium]|nr:hypothetical protein [Pseudomonadota bacterium]